ncbi:MAG TPA: endospore germination permease [Firmicutes bacterium]|nr:endospore germination permease [Bacillota bacterium]
MPEKGKIDTKQAIMLSICLILPTAMLSVPAVIIRHARQDAWISLILSIFIGLLVARLIVSLSFRFPDKTLFQYSEEILGRVPGKIVGLLYLWWVLHSNAIAIDEFASLPCVALMPDTPFVAFFIIAIVVAGYAVRNGLEVLSRYIELITPIGLGLMVSLFCLLTTKVKFERLLPVFDKGLVSIVKGAAMPSGWMGEIVLFSMFIPYLNKPREACRVAVLSILIIGIFMVSVTVGILLVFGPDVSSSWIFPVFMAIRAISIANFLERVESVVIGIWVFMGFAKIGVLYYAAVLGSAQWLGLKDYRPLVAPVGIVLLGLAFLCPNIIDLLDFLARAFPPYALIVFELGIPLILLGASLIRGRRGESS